MNKLPGVLFLLLVIPYFGRDLQQDCNTAFTLFSSRLSLLCLVFAFDLLVVNHFPWVSEWPGLRLYLSISSMHT